MYRNQSSQQLSVFEQAQDNHKDIVIATLKKELCQVRDLETDYFRITDQIARLQSKYTLLLEEKDRHEREHKLKMDINKKVISDMRGDMDALKSQIHQTSTHIEESMRDNATLKRMCDNRNTEIASLMTNNRELEKRNQAQIQENRNLTFSIKQFKQEKSKLELECEKLHDALDTSVQTLKNIEKQTRVLQNANNKLENSLALLQEDNVRLLEEMKSREGSILKTENTLNDLQSKTESVKQKNKQIQSECVRLEGDCSGCASALEMDIKRNKDLTLKVRNLDNSIRATESELQESVFKKQNLKKDHFSLVDDNRSLNLDIDACLIDILDLEKVNQELQKEIENYIDTDQQARNMLNRKDVMKSLISQVNQKLDKTSDQIAHLR